MPDEDDGIRMMCRPASTAHVATSRRAPLLLFLLLPREITAILRAGYSPACPLRFENGLLPYSVSPYQGTWGILQRQLSKFEWAAPDHLQPVKLILQQKKFHLFTLPPIIIQFLLPPERGRKEGAGTENGKMELSKSEWNTWVSDLWAFKLDHLQPVNLIFFCKNFPPFYSASRNKPLLITPERKEQGLKIGKRNHP